MESYRKLFEEQFDSQIGNYSSAKRKRMDGLSNVLDKIAQQPELLAAISKKDFGAAGQMLRSQLESLSGDRLLSELSKGFKIGLGRSRAGGAQTNSLQAWIADWDAFELVPIPLATRPVQEVADEARHVFRRPISHPLPFQQPRYQRDRERNGREKHGRPTADHLA